MKEDFWVLKERAEDRVEGGVAMEVKLRVHVAWGLGMMHEYGPG